MNKTFTQPTILIFGAGVAGLNAYQQLNAKNHILAFVDNSTSKQNTLIHQTPVVSPDKIATLEFDEIIIASEFFEKIQQQLVDEYAVDIEKIKVLPSHMLSALQFGHSTDIEDIGGSILLLLGRCLSDAKIPYFIDAGTLLGIYRDAALIPWDDDLDLAIAESSADKAYVVLLGAIEHLNQLTGGDWQLETHYCEQAYGVIEVGNIRSFKLKNIVTALSLPMIDVFIKYVVGETMDYTLASRGVTMASRHIQNLQTIDFNGARLSIPCDPEGYLESYYGDWRTPIKNWDLSMIKAAKPHDN